MKERPRRALPMHRAICRTDAVYRHGLPAGPEPLWVRASTSIVMRTPGWAVSSAAAAFTSVDPVVQTSSTRTTPGMPDAESTGSLTFFIAVYLFLAFSMRCLPCSRVCDLWCLPRKAFTTGMPVTELMPRAISSLWLYPRRIRLKWWIGTGTRHEAPVKIPPAIISIAMRRPRKRARREYPWYFISCTNIPEAPSGRYVSHAAACLMASTEPIWFSMRDGCPCLWLSRRSEARQAGHTNIPASGSTRPHTWHRGGAMSESRSETTGIFILLRMGGAPLADG